MELDLNKLSARFKKNEKGIIIDVFYLHMPILSDVLLDMKVTQKEIDEIDHQAIIVAIRGLIQENKIEPHEINENWTEE